MQQRDLSVILSCLQSQQDLSRPQMRAVIDWFLSGEADAVSMHELLVLLADKGESFEELVGAADALRASMVRLASNRRPIVDTCGTGGDGAKTFNISTAAAIVIAAAGVSVAKHGNRKITSSTGSADVLAELGIDLTASPDVVQNCLEYLGICFCFAPHFHPAMKHVSEVRKSIPRPTIFNRLGPLANPALADRQVLGVGAKNLQSVMARALQALGTTHSLVVRGNDGVDELSLSTTTRVLEVKPDQIREFELHPRDFGLQTADRDALFADDPASSADCIRNIFDGHTGPKRDVVVMNAAAGLWIAQAETELADCARLAELSIDNGQAKKLISDLARATTQGQNCTD